MTAFLRILGGARMAKRTSALTMTLLLLLSSLGATTQTTSAQIVGQEPPLTIIVDKWVCPASVPLDAPIETFLERCWPSTDTFNFALQTPAGMSAKSTVAGMVGWKDVPRGPIRISEQVPPQYGTTVIFCSHITQLEIPVPTTPGSFDPRPYHPAGVISPIGVLETKAVDVSLIYCHWFNVLGNGQGE